MVILILLTRMEILQKKTEQLLMNKDIKMAFLFDHKVNNKKTEKTTKR